MSNVISIFTECLDLYSLAFCHNKIKLLKSVTLSNISDFNLKNLELEITSSPEFFSDFTMRIGEISSGRYSRFSQIDLSVDTTKLSYLFSSVTSTVTISVKSHGEILAEKNVQVQLLPYDHVPSSSFYPELISAFVCPSQFEVRIIGESVHKYIGDTNIPANMDMWKQCDRETSYAVVRAIYETVRALRITYNTSTLFLDTKHVKVKLPESLISTKNGNAFEIALLFASVCEYIGFNPFIVLNSGKAYVGVFFTSNTFKSPIVDDGRLLLPLSDGICHNYCIIDPSSLVNGTNISFEDSSKMAHKSIGDEDFPLIVDIKECRNAGLYPIYNRICKDGNIIFEETSCKNTGVAFEFPNNNSILTSKIKNSLSQISYSSNLISGASKNSAFLVGNGKSIVTKFVFNSRVNLKCFSVPGVVSQNDEDMLNTLIKLNENSDLTDVSDTVSTLYEKEKFKKRLVKLLDSEKSKSSLYLAFGIISGSVNGNSISAPLFLTPATLTYDNQSFYLSISKNSTVVNGAIFDYLNASIGFSLPFDLSSYNFLEDYNDITNKLHNEALKFEGLEVIDAVFLLKTQYEDYLVSTACSASHFEKSGVIQKLLNRERFNAVDFKNVTSDELQPNFFDMPLLLDSTQADAYNAALSNSCTVIYGPNGSGKTRVAASVAYSALENGESVLYVSNSDSNINQFNSYSKDIGISDFSASVSKNNFQNNLFDTTSDSSENVEQINALKQEITDKHGVISNYYSALHKVREIGFSLYEAVSQYERYKTFPYSVNFTNSEVSHLSKEDVVRWFDVVSNLAKAGADCHEPFNNPLMYIKCKDFSYELKSNALLSLANYKDKTSKFIAAQNKLIEYLGIEVSVIKEEQTDNLIALSELILNKVNYIFPSVYTKPNAESELASFEGFFENVTGFYDRKEFIDSNFSSDILSLDIDALLNEWRSASLKFAITRAGAQNAVKNKIKLFAYDHKSITNDNITELFSKLSEYKSDILRISDISPVARQLFGVDIDFEISKGNKGVFEHLSDCVKTTREYNRIIADIYLSEKKPQSIFSHNDSLFSNKGRFLKEFSELYENFANCKNELFASEKSITELLNLDIENAKKDNSKIWYYFLEKFLDRMLDNIDLLKHWCAWNRAQDVAISAGLSNLVTLYKSEQMTYNDIRNAFLKGFFKTVSEYILSCEPDINNFSKESFEEIERSLLKNAEKLRKFKISEFKDSLTKLIENKLTDSNSVPMLQALIQLRRDFSFNDKFYNISDDSKNLLHMVRPCIVAKGMSYLSQFANKLKAFDLLVVDAVDDYTLEELALLIPLGKRIVLLTENVCTNELVNSLVSQGVPCLPLSWLYSYNFSTRLVNKMFYPLSTSFVFTNDDRNGIRVIRQKASYDRKNTRTNFIEASAVVDEIMKKLDVSFSSSISVVAVTEEQASLIELLFTKRLQSLSDAKRRAFFDRTVPFSISSLEKATFNPCDTVILSTTFSVEEKPKYNDTISRTLPEFSNQRAIHSLINTLLCAQNEFVLVTSLDTELLDRFKTVIPGYATFKEIITSLTEPLYLPDSEMNKASRIENSIIRQVINHIESLGYHADIDVGTNSCRIDIAVKKNNGSGYAFGIVFDESAYMYGGDLLSRALIRKNLTENLGWKIIRIYTVEWFENSPKQLDMITEMLKDEEEKNTINPFVSFQS